MLEKLSRAGTVPRPDAGSSLLHSEHAQFSKLCQSTHLETSHPVSDPNCSCLSLKKSSGSSSEETAMYLKWQTPRHFFVVKRILQQKEAEQLS